MQISIDALLAVVAETKGRGFPCMLDPLRNLIRTVHGECAGPSAPGFMRDMVTAGFVVLQQQPTLDSVQLPDFENKVMYTDWLKDQLQAGQLEGLYDIQPPAATALAAAKTQAIAVLRSQRST